MEKELPIVDIGGEIYEVDVIREEFVRVRNRNSTIGFDFLQYTDQHYYLNYSWRERDRAENQKHLGDQMGRAIIPHMTVLDPEAMALKYNRPLSEVLGKTDFEVMVNQDLYEKRMAGELPVIEIMGKEFLVDLDNGVLKAKDDLNSGTISFHMMNPLPLDGPQSYRFAYNPHTQKSEGFRYDRDEEKMAYLKLVEIPSLEKLDPVAFARFLKEDVKDFLVKNPIQEKLKGEVVPWEKPKVMVITDADRRRVAKILDDEVKSTRRKGKRL